MANSYFEHEDEEGANGITVHSAPGEDVTVHVETEDGSASYTVPEAEKRTLALTICPELDQAAQPKPAPTVCRPSPGIDPERGATLNIDFDGTVVTHAFPDIGHDIGAVPVLRELVEAGHHLILFTMRSGEYLDAAVDWYAQHGLPLYGINTNPTQTSWTQSPKSYAKWMIDDSTVCAPLAFNPDVSDRPFIDWVRMRELLVEHGLLVDWPTVGGAR